MTKEKPASTKEKKGMTGLIAILGALWLAGLTGLVMMNMKSPQGSDLESRITKLESRDSKVSGKINPAEGKQLAAMEQRIDLLEKNLADMTGQSLPIQGAAGTPGDAGAAVQKTSAGACDCNNFADRLDKLESLVLSKKGGESAPRAAAAEQTKVETAAKPAKKASGSRTRAWKAAKKPSYRNAEPEYTTAPAARGGASDNVKRYDSIFEISSRTDPIYRHPDDTTRDVSKFAPGAGIYTSLPSFNQSDAILSTGGSTAMPNPTASPAYSPYSYGIVR
jgi:hypothetical protein